MKFLLLLISFIFSISSGYAQDILTKKNGEELQVKVLEIALTEVKYKLYQNQDGPLYAIPKADIFSIRYVNGTKDVFTAEGNAGAGLSSSNPQEMFTKGRSDALIYYKGYKSAGTGTLITSLISPLVGLIPAIACTSVTPKDHNLGYTNTEEFNNPDYRNGYKQSAKQIKSRKVWKNLGIGLAANLIFVLATYQQQ